MNIEVGQSLTHGSKDMLIEESYSAASPFSSIIRMSKLPISGMALPAMPWRSP
jgi:hypothetical protein